MHFFVFHMTDYLEKTAHLTPIEDIAYRRLIDLYYTSEKPIVADVRRAARLIRMSDNVDVVESVLREFFVLNEEVGWVNNRCDEVIEEYRSRPKTESKADGERERQKRHRERKREMFDALRAVGVVPAWNIRMDELQALHDTHLSRTCHAPVTLPDTTIPITNNQEPISTPNGVEGNAQSAPPPKAKRTVRVAMVRPTLEEAVELFSTFGERGTPIMAEMFWNHFESNGWRTGGKSPMENWQRSAKNWYLRDLKDTGFAPRPRGHPVPFRGDVETMQDRAKYWQDQLEKQGLVRG